jgi:4-oxalmesaconate hydratase
MIIDCHGHFTTAPKTLHAWRKKQLDAIDDPSNAPRTSDLNISDDEIRAAIDGGQLKLQKERGGDLTLFSPIAGQMAHHLGNEQTSLVWAEVCNDLIHRVCALYPDSFVGVCQLPQSPGVSPANCVPELRRCIEDWVRRLQSEPGSSGGYWQDPPLTDRFWYPITKRWCGSDVPGHGARQFVLRPCFHGTRCAYINGDTTAFPCSSFVGPLQGLSGAAIRHPPRQRSHTITGAVIAGCRSRQRSGRWSRSSTTSSLIPACNTSRASGFSPK